MKYRHFFLKSYFGSFAVLGFYRGWNSDYTMKYNQKIENVKYDLLTDKFISKLFRATINSINYATIGHGIAIQKFMGRMEIFLTQKNPYDHKDYYVEIFDFTTLKPEVNSD